MLVEASSYQVVASDRVLPEYRRLASAFPFNAPLLKRHASPARVSGFSGISLGVENSLRCAPAKWYHFRSSLQLVQIVGPFLHHYPPLRQIFRSIVGSTDLIALAMG